MRFVPIAVLLATATVLSGCVGTSLDAIANLSIPCTNTVTTLNCSGPVSATTTTTTTSTNSGNTAAIVTGDTTLAVENGSVVSTASNMAVSTLTQTTLPTSTATMSINTNTATNGNWPVAKTMDEFVAGSAVPSGIGGAYKEYHQISKVPGSGNTVDEELQVWKWAAGTGNTYATQYRNVSGGKANPAVDQAWSFGGTYTTAAQMSTSANATYSGRFTAVATTSNFFNPTSMVQTLDRNNTWSVTGASVVNATFGSSGTITGTLTPKAWTAWQTLNSATGFATTTASTGIPANWFTSAQGGYMDVPIQLSGTISTNPSTAAGTHGNTVSGVAQYDPTSNWVNTSTNSFLKAGFFGNNADDITGVFSMDAQTLNPIGGTAAINDDRRGYVSMTGIFNACKTGPFC